MPITVRRTRAALRKFDAKQKYWHDATLIADDAGGATIITYWRNPELAGVWEFRYTVLRKCFLELLRQQRIELDDSKEPNTYKLSAEGRKWLGEN